MSLLSISKNKSRIPGTGEKGMAITVMIEIGMYFHHFSIITGSTNRRNVIAESPAMIASTAICKGMTPLFGE
jgi:hypothetical protein